MKDCLCGLHDRAQTDEFKRSKQIDKDLKRNAKIYQATIKLLLLGAGESGKSTVVKQMKIIHTSKYTNEERVKKIPDIKSNIKDTILSILVAMERLQVNLENESLKDLREYILESISEAQDINEEFQYTDKFWNCIEELWKDNGVKRCAITYGDQYNLLDSAQYFLDRIHIIRQSSYLPDDQDILRCRVLTNGILETRFRIRDVHFYIFDVGGQREERRKWIQCFNEVTAIIFVVDISAYNMTLREDAKVNRLRESLNLFRSIWVNRWLSRVSIILFLNKYDIFSQKIQSGQCKLEDYFPEYVNYELPRNLNKTFKIENENVNVTRAKMFILELFIDITNEDLSDALNILSNGVFNPESYQQSLKENPSSHSQIPVTPTTPTTVLTPPSTNESSTLIGRKFSSYLNGSNKQLINRDIFYKMNNNYVKESISKKFCIPYFTCAVDTENIKRVFKACNNILQKEHLEKSGLI